MTFPTAQFQLTRHFTAGADRLWHLLTDPKSRKAWSGPSDDDVLHLDAADLREGGEDLHRCGPADAPSYTVATRWYRLDGPQAACFTETVEAQDTRIATSLVTYGLIAEGAQTRLTVSVNTVSFVGVDALADFEAGWTAALDRLPKFLEPAQ